MILLKQNKLGNYAKQVKYHLKNTGKEHTEAPLEISNIEITTLKKRM